MSVTKTSDHFQIKNKIPNPSQEPPASSKAMTMGQSKTSEHIQIVIMKPNPCQEPLASFKAPNDNLNDMDVLCIKMKNP